MTTIKHGDAGRRITLHITDADHEPVDITGANPIVLVVRILGGAPITLVCTVVDGADGMAAYDLTGAEFPSPGEYRGVARVTLPGGETFTSPTEGAVCITVEPTIGVLA